MFARFAAISNKAAKERAVPLPAFGFPAPSNAEGFVGFALSLTLTATIADSSDIVLSMDAAPASASGAFTDHGDGTASLLWTPTSGDIGPITFSFSAGDAYGRSITRTWTVAVSQPAVGEVLEVTARPVAMPTVDISDGAADFAHWGLVNSASVNRKLGTPTLGNLTSLNGSFVRYIHESDTRQRIAWTGGDPTATEAGTRSGIYANGVGAGLRLTVPVTAVSQELTLYCARGNASANVVATISGGPTKQVALPFTADATDAVVGIQFFGESTQTLTVDVVKTSDNGSVAVRAARLTGSIALAWSDPLSGTVYEPLTSTLTVSGFAGTATIAATNLPGSATFADNGDNTATFSMVPAVGDAAASPLIFGVTVFDGATSLISTQYSLTVAAATTEPPSIALGSTLEFAVGTAKSVTVSATGATPIALTVSGLPGAATWLDNGNSTATLTWQPASGDDDGSPYPITITATDVAGRRTTLNQSITVTDAAAVDLLSMTVLSTANSGDFNLTANGGLDWIRWARATSTDVDRKDGVTPIISDVGIVAGTTTLSRGVSGGRTVSFSDGTPTGSSTATGVLKVASTTFSIAQITVPASSSTRTLYLAFGGYDTPCVLTASMNGVTTVSETSERVTTTQTAWVVAVEFRSATAQTLTIQYQRGRDGGNVWMQGAALKEGGL